jgi:hypothetical protein
MRIVAAILFVAVLSPKVPAESPLTKLRQETRELLREEAIASSVASKEAAVHALCDWYVVLRSDQSYEASDMLQGDAAKVRRRLLSIARSRESQLKRDRVPRPDEISSQVDAAIRSALSEETTVSDLLESSKTGMAPGGLADDGWQLVELIQRIVSPDFWEPTGGPGAIRYFAMRRVLVVRATSDVHEQIKDLLTALR